MSKFVRVGQSAASPASITQRREVVVDPYVDERGYIQNAGLTFQPIVELERGAIDGPRAIILHRTFSSTASGTMTSFRQQRIGTHFLVEKDGTIYQCASLKKKTAHVGPIHSRCLKEGTCPPEETKSLSRMGPKQGHDHEKTKPYPSRYPMNEDSVGIETVAMYSPTTKQWDAATSQQRESISKLVKLLQSLFSLTDSDVYEHDKISRKTEGEGADLYDGTGSVPTRFPPPFF